MATADESESALTASSRADALYASEGDRELELTILLPCLNEAETLEVCIVKAQSYLDRSGVLGEILVADNGSTDGSQEIAIQAGARVVSVPEKGYGSALRGGTEAALGRYVIMGDADDSYDFSNLDDFVAQLRSGVQLVMGDRFAGGIQPGAMPPLHKYLGNPVLSWIGRLFFRTGIRDFHCGLRGFDRASIRGLELRTTGMEFASEVVVKACLADLRIAEVPVALSVDGRSRAPHLRSWRDGWRHLRFLLLYSPRWLFMIPGLVLLVLGLSTDLVLLFGSVRIGSVEFDVSTMVYAASFAVAGYQSVIFAVLSELYAQHEGFLPPRRRFGALLDRFTLERGVLVGVAVFLVCLGGCVAQVLRWGDGGFGHLDPTHTVRVAVPAGLGMMLGMQTVLFSMFVGILTIKTNHRVVVRGKVH